MYTDFLTLQFHGFHPSDYTRDCIDQLLGEIEEEAPVGATVKAHFTRQGHEFKGLISIHSRAGQFFARASGPRLKEVNGRLIAQIRKQISKWKATRLHEHESLKDYALTIWGEDNESPIAS
jgi:hypothetical protein